MPKVSIIIPLYNKAPYITKALESVKVQTFADWECIIVNDGSTDKSADVVREWLEVSGERSEGKFRLIDQENAGVSAARNHGISLSIGGFVAFLDADDWWAPTFLEEMTRLVEDYPEAGIWGCNYYKVRNGKETKVLDIETGYFNYFKSYVDVRMPLWTGAVLVKKSIIEKRELRNEKGDIFPVGIMLGEDFDLWLRIALRYKTAFLNKCLAYYNNDVQVSLKASRKLYAPEHNIAWNLDKYEPNLWEGSMRGDIDSQDVKRLIDMIRLIGWKAYYLDDMYRDKVLTSLEIIDRDGQPKEYQVYYETPVWQHKIKNLLLQMGSYVKQKLFTLRRKCYCVIFNG